MGLAMYQLSCPMINKIYDGKNMVELAKEVRLRGQLIFIISL